MKIKFRDPRENVVSNYPAGIILRPQKDQTIKDTRNILPGLQIQSHNIRLRQNYQKGQACLSRELKAKYCEFFIEKINLYSRDVKQK